MFVPLRWTTREMSSVYSARQWCFFYGYPWAELIGRGNRPNPLTYPESLAVLDSAVDSHSAGCYRDFSRLGSLGCWLHGSPMPAEREGYQAFSSIAN